MKTWTQFAALRPDLAEPGRALLYLVGVGLGYLATTRSDGAPRVHPMCPGMTDAGLFAFIVPVFVAERARLGVPPPSEEDLLFEFMLGSCLLARTTGHGDPNPAHRVWRDG